MNRMMYRLFACALCSALLALPTACTKSNKEAPAQANVEKEPVDQGTEQAADAEADNEQQADVNANADADANAKARQNMFGGPVYEGEPALDVTAALVKAGGGADNFDFSTALVNMLGEDTVNKEVAKLTEQYGEDEVNTFVKGMTGAVNISLKIAGEKGITLPEPADLSGVDLAKSLVQAGTTDDGTFWSGYMFDHALSHDLHNAVMAEINKTAGRDVDKTTHKILNQAMYDVAQALGAKNVKLADLH